MSASAIKRIINKDIKEIHKMNLAELGIHIHFDEENMLQAKAIIIGPKNTPYENGVLYFKIVFPTNYPFSPPKVSYLSSSRYRIHPNLYVGKSCDNYEGKVCLSILNTWSGPKWSSIMHIGSILVSIQSLLDENPLRNEPGFEKEYSSRNINYNRIVEYDTYQQLIYNHCIVNQSFNEFREIIKHHIDKNKENILSNLDELCKTNPKEIVISFDIYNIYMRINYQLIREKINLK
jgi:ubiquitin-protein ligase